MRHSTRAFWAAIGPFIAAALLLSGCGGNNQAAKRDNFFTSGSREADQRASQRMAKEEQLSEDSSDKKESKKDARKERNDAQSTPMGDAEQAEARRTLYERLGGETGLRAIVEDFTPRVLQDPRVNWERKGIKRGGLAIFKNEEVTWQASPQNVAILKKHMQQFLALATGGPPRYDGKEMKQAHAEMQITNPEFDAVIGDLKATLDKLQIPSGEQKELLAIVESTRPQIVTKK